jgi:cullin-4
LDSSTKRDLLILLEDHVIERQQQALINDDALANLLDDNANPELTALYALLDRRRLGDKLSPPFAKWVETTGTSIVFASNTDDMIVHLLSLKRRLDATWRTAFQRNESLGHALRDSFALFMNKTKKGDATWGTDNTKVGEMIAKYVDQLLRGGVKAIPEVLTARRASTTAVEASAAGEEDNEDPDVDEDAEVNVQLDQVLDLFRFVQGKAVFEAFYKKDLARRLLMGRSASADAERSMLARLKTECGSGFTQNLEQMFKDVELAREELQSYKQRLEDRVDYEKGKALDLSVNILSSAAWPTYPDIPVIIPANVKRAIDGFELHYKSKHTGRKLDWKHALAHCQMRAKFSKGVKELVVSSFQAIILLLFNDLGEDQQKPYSEILAESGLRKFFSCDYRSSYTY